MNRARILVAAVLILAAVLALRALGWLVGAELVLYDQYLRLAAPPAPPSSVVLVQITEQDIQDQGHWPISDRSLAEALERLVGAGARVIGLDLYRDLRVGPGTERLTRLLREEPRIIAVRRFGAHGERGIAGPPVLEGTGRVGFNDLPRDDDDVFRRGLLFQDDGTGAPEWSFALRVAVAALAGEGIAPAPDPQRREWLRLGETTVPYFEADDGGYVGADDAGYQFALDFAARRAGFDTLTLGDALRGPDPERVRDRVVVVGSNAISIPDFASVPGGAPVPGMELHGHAIDQLVRFGRGQARPLRVLAEWQEVALIALVALLGCAIGLGVPGRALLRTTAQIAAVLAGLAALWGAGALAFRAGWWVPTAAPALAWLGSAGVVTAWVSSREQAHREELMRIFAAAVSPQVADEIWGHREEVFAEGRVRARRLVATVFFVDLRGYTAQAEKMEPERLMEWSNAFMERMAETISAFGGVVDDYFGDGIKANFGVPIPRESEAEIASDARQAVRCALAVGDALEALNAEHGARELPPYAAKIGIHTGPVVAGSIGSVERTKYTVVGDVAVTAQRLESTAAVPHDYAAQPLRILISERTAELLDASFATEPLGPIALKGMDAPMGVHRVLGGGGP